MGWEDDVQELEELDRVLAAAGKPQLHEMSDEDRRRALEQYLPHVKAKP